MLISSLPEKQVTESQNPMTPMQKSQNMIDKHGFETLAVEADWPDAWLSTDMFDWSQKFRSRNHRSRVSLHGCGRMRRFTILSCGSENRINLSMQGAESDSTAFISSLYSSVAEVTRYLDRVDPKAATTRARRRYCHLRWKIRQSMVYLRWAGEVHPARTLSFKYSLISYRSVELCHSRLG